jgi:hypothetical protein
MASLKKTTVCIIVIVQFTVIMLVLRQEIRANILNVDKCFNFLPTIIKSRHFKILSFDLKTAETVQIRKNSIKKTRFMILCKSHDLFYKLGLMKEKLPYETRFLIYYCKISSKHCVFRIKFFRSAAEVDMT